jgi:hypothetical protein
VIKAVEGAAGVKIAAPPRVNPSCDLSVSDSPLEDVLASLGECAALSLKSGVVFEELPKPLPAQDAGLAGKGGGAPDPEVEEGLARQESGSSLILEDLNRIAKMREVAGKDPFDPRFHWDTITPDQWKKIGPGGPDREAFMERVDRLVEDRRKVEALSEAVLSGHPEAAAEIDPTFDPSPAPPAETPAEPPSEDP